MPDKNNIEIMKNDIMYDTDIIYSCILFLVSTSYVTRIDNNIV